MQMVICMVVFTAKVIIDQGRFKNLYISKEGKSETAMAYKDKT